MEVKVVGAVIFLAITCYFAPELLSISLAGRIPRASLVFDSVIPAIQVGKFQWSGVTKLVQTIERGEGKAQEGKPVCYGLITPRQPVSSNSTLAEKRRSRGSSCESFVAAGRGPVRRRLANFAPQNALRLRTKIMCVKSGEKKGRVRIRPRWRCVGDNKQQLRTDWLRNNKRGEGCTYVSTLIFSFQAHTTGKAMAIGILKKRKNRGKHQLMKGLNYIRKWILARIALRGLSSSFSREETRSRKDENRITVANIAGTKTPHDRFLSSVLNNQPK